MQNNFRLDARVLDGACVISVSGELDLASSPRLEDELARISASGAQRVIVDLRELDFMDSTGLSVLVKAHQRAEHQGTRLGLTGGSQQVQRLLRLTGVADRLNASDVPEDLLCEG